MRQVLGRRMRAVTLVMDDTHKAHNRAAVVRSCEAFGVQRAHFLIPPRSQEKLALSKLVSKGSHRWMDIVEHQSAESVLSELRASAHTILVTHPQGELKPSDLPSLSKVALVMGNEKLGVRSELSKAAASTIAIPMTGFVESLNVSVTAAILLQAATAGRGGDLGPEESENIYARWLRNSVPRADEVLNSFPPC
jgi:tRNA (guanosine-2'-O-)-methyltransferase